MGGLSVVVVAFVRICWPLCKTQLICPLSPFAMGGRSVRLLSVSPQGVSVTPVEGKSVPAGAAAPVTAVLIFPLPALRMRAFVFFPELLTWVPNPG